MHFRKRIHRPSSITLTPLLTCILDSGRPVREARDTFILISGYCVIEKALSNSLSCALLKVVRFLRR